MPVRFETRENGRIVYLTFVDPWNISELLDCFNEDLAHRNKFMTEYPGKKIHTVVDVRQTKDIARGTLRLRAAPALKHPTAGQNVGVGANAFLRSVSDILQRLAGKDQAKFFATEEEAMRYLQEEIAKESEPNDLHVK
jgi:hypothetical protein